MALSKMDLRVSGTTVRGFVIVHDQNFVNPLDERVHTQTIEGTWMQMKRKMKSQSGTLGRLLPTYLAEYIGRRSPSKKNPFGCILACIGDQYKFPLHLHPAAPPLPPPVPPPAQPRSHCQRSSQSHHHRLVLSSRRQRLVLSIHRQRLVLSSHRLLVLLS
ncbi:hypothetical protein TCAL_15436 [Tigriopus californicus]|uniref:Uncharacterized protein n=1 Tax=Tigriopus californicus TaxID=6832 RepID=A0A553PRB1_TIGCA|nr:hypothetical protein TCAL_15436 [Tigriopus californicus]